MDRKRLLHDCFQMLAKSMTVTRLPTKYGQGHADAIGYVQDALLPAIIENKIAALVIRAVCDDGTEFDYTVHAIGDRRPALQMIGLLAEAQADILARLSASPSP
jgi:hypothetical protein